MICIFLCAPPPPPPLYIGPLKTPYEVVEAQGLLKESLWLLTVLFFKMNVFYNFPVFCSESGAKSFLFFR